MNVQLSPHMLFALTILMLVTTLYVYCKIRAALLKVKCLFKLCKCCTFLLCACRKQVDKISPADDAVAPAMPQFSTEASSNPMSGMVVEGSHEGSQYSNWN
eukprot:COSAG02_NODE_3979_length_5959_cov_17.318430_2_plen_101_part_00